MNKRMCVVAFMDEGMLVVGIKDVAAGSIEHIEQLGQAALVDYVDAHRLYAVPTTCILHQSEYQLFKMKKPAVPQKALAETIRWQEQDRFQVPANQLAIETQDCSAEPGRQAEDIMVVAIEKNRLQQAYHLLDKCSLAVKKITVPEFCYPSYLKTSHVDHDVIVVMRIYQDFSEALVFVQHTLTQVVRLPIVHGQEIDMGELVRPITEVIGDQNPFWLVESSVPQVKEFVTKLESLKNGAVEQMQFNEIEAQDSSTVSVLLEVNHV